VALHRLTAAARRISRQLRFDLWLEMAALSPALARRCGRFIVETFRFLPHDPATDETFE
jgi:hypothetical protein